VKVLDFDWRGKKVLVTGASGFKGGWLCAALLRLGSRVYGTVRSQRDAHSAFEVFGIDDLVVKSTIEISDRQQVYDLINSVEPDVIFHLAAKALVPGALRDPRRTFEVNFMGTLNVIEACRKLRICARVLVCSTDHVFGNVEPAELPEGGFNERSRVSYSGPYDTSKATMELMVRCDHYTYWPEVPALGISRCANVFGFGDTNQRRVIPLFVREAVSSGVIPLRFRKSGRQFIHVTDAIAGYLRAASSLDEGGYQEKNGKPRPEERSPFTPSFHFAIENYTDNPEPYIRMASLAHQVADLFGARVDDSDCADYPLNENKVQALNCAATRDALRWKAQKPLGAALKELGAWYEPQADRRKLRQLAEQDLDVLISSATQS